MAYLAGCSSEGGFCMAVRLIFQDWDGRNSSGDIKVGKI